MRDMIEKTAAVLVATGLLSGAAMAQEPAGPSGGALILQQLLFFLPLIAIFYFLLIRPQQKRRREHQAMLEAIKRGDTIITSGGLIGKVTKAGETELTVELADNVQVRVVKTMVADVRGKGQPVAANDSKPA